MFQDKYRRDMEKVTPSPESLQKTREKMLKVCQNKPRRLFYKPLIAATACLLLTTCILSFAIPQISSNAPLNDAIHITDSNNLNNKISKDSSQNSEGYKDVPSNGKGYSKQDPKKENDNSEELNTDIDYSNDFQFGSGNCKDYIKNSYTDIFSNLKLSSFPENTKVIDNSSENSQTTPTTGSNASTEVYSDTNNQVKGVQEADIVKTDGKYIYACGNALKGTVYYSSINRIDVSDGKVYIFSAENGKLNLVSIIPFRSEHNNIKYALREILLYDNTLVLIKEGYMNEDSSTSNSIDNFYRISCITTAVEIYDITDRAKPVFKNELYQSGLYNSSRMIGRYLYIISTYFVYSPDINNPESYIPFCSPYNEKKLIPADCILVPDTISSNVYNVITGMDVTKPDNFKSSTAALGYQGTIYVNDRNIYIASYTYFKFETIKLDDSASSDAATSNIRTTTDGTNIYRFSINEGKVTAAATGKIAGKLINQFAMDEYNNTLRVAATVTEFYLKYRQGNNNDLIPSFLKAICYNDLFVLDMDLNLIGAIHNMAPDETIRSVRFDGNVGYVVTFRNVDPLFAIDLSNPKSPKVLSALKIPGFSTYMHPYGNGLLFGLGKDTDTNVIKLSMFDVTDKTNVSEIAVYKLNNDCTYSEALQNHKAVLIDPEKNIIGFPVNDYNQQYNSYISFKLYTFENNSFYELGSIPLPVKANESIRGLYIGNYIYVFAQNAKNILITSYDINTFAQIDSFTLN